MTSPILKYSNKNTYVVEWPELSPVASITNRIKLLKFLILDIKAFEVGLMIELPGNQCDVLWVDPSVVYQNNSYSDYVQEMYKIKGVVFKEERCADEFVDFLEKKLMWRILSGNTV